MNDTLLNKIKAVIEKNIAPTLQTHNGGMEVTKIEDGVVTVRLLGSCTRCASANDTLNDFIKIEIMNNVPEVKDVLLDDSVPEDMLEFARKILNHTLDK